MIIRRLEEADAEAFRALRLRALQEHPEAFGASYEDEAGQSVASFAARLHADPAWPLNFILGAFDPELIGMVGFHRESARKVRHKGSIWGMYVGREARGRGVGRALVEQALAEARLQPGLEQIRLMVVSTNDVARRLYRSLGFAVYGVEHHALKLGDRYVDEDLMVFPVPSPESA